LKILLVRAYVRLGIEAPADLLLLREEMTPHEQDKAVEPETWAYPVDIKQNFVT
jgi:sRNA-binding carbon storage regulator CsrA